jgi:hypothetical protein
LLFDVQSVIPVIPNAIKMVSSDDVLFLAIFKIFSVVLNTFPVEFSGSPFINLKV